MTVENVLILAAGAGTRMGEIGKILPKVLWPVFERSLLELEVLYAKSLGAKNVFINSHYYTTELLGHIENNSIFENVELLIENEPIDIGGAVHNLADKLGYRGELLILNSDQFIFVDENVWAEAFERFKTSSSVLFSYQVNSSDMYNALDVKSGRLSGIINNSSLERNKSVKTYTGMSLIRLDDLIPCKGKSSFFDSVANFKNQNVQVVDINDSEYWDFGTLDRYWKSCFSILEKVHEETSDRFVSFLLNHKAILEKKVEGSCYNASSSEKVINLSDKKVSDAKNVIILSGEPRQGTEEKRIVFKSLVERI
ncbi:MAG: hypothetical protein CME64_07200 [Halobacteriovoraceae bacterium]|nr:hypothetical protein [Halobacteriovoraceae bacterium]|tara:strand:+ start:59834 stop:60766 length:933 start_codon:yes stop_codon:yes gene_type:complete